MTPQSSLVHGPKEPPLRELTFGQLTDEQAENQGDRVCLISSWQNVRFSFNEFSQRSKIVAKALLGTGVQHGDCIGMFAGNCYQNLEVFVAAARIGCPTVSFNLTYTPAELLRAAEFTSCKIIFIPTCLGTRYLSDHIEGLLTLPQLRYLVIINGHWQHSGRVDVRTYEGFYQMGTPSSAIHDRALRKAQSRVKPADVLNIQFTSGTTGAPKAAMLTHFGLINNAQIAANRQQITSADTSICSAPLFHCLGMVLCFILPLVTGATNVIPAEQFDPVAAVDAVLSTRATVLTSVPTMFVAYLDVLRKRNLKLNTLRRGICAGSTVPPPMVAQVEDVLGMKNITNAFGMTELSPGAFIGDPADDVQHRVVSVGKILPHTAAKIIDPATGETVPVGTKGELCVSGYLVFKGYLHNTEKTDEVKKTDADGVVWMHTGDECYFDSDGYCYITGRIKDIIIRGGENIYPGEIELRLAAHQGIAEASVVGVQDERYGELVACFLRAADGDAGKSGRPSDEEVRRWVREKLGRQKVPKYVFWIGDEDVGHDYPKTGSGKHQKFELRKIAEKLLETTEKERKGRAKL